MHSGGDAMSMQVSAAQQRDAGTRDEGSALILVLVMMVRCSLIVLPILNYGMTVSRQNTVLSNKSKNQEAAKAGLRTALADPSHLYNYCFDNVTLPSPKMDGISVANTCHVLGETLAAADSELHLGLVATRVGEAIPPGLQAIILKDDLGNPILDVNGNPVRAVFQPQTADAREWLDPAATYAPAPESEPRRIWAPNLPAHALNQRAAAGFQMPAGYPTCRVFFPGTYSDPITLDGPTYFASGIYYFESSVTVSSGADVIVGLGQHLGCTNDQEAAFYAVNAPGTHNISGLGATFIFGSKTQTDTDGKLIVTNAAGPTSIRFNQRYVNAKDTGGTPSFGVSIVSVNGDRVSGPDSTGQFVLADLVVPGVNEVSASLVTVLDPAAPIVAGEPPATQLVSAGMQNYEPSRLTHEPRPPTAPRWLASNPVIPLRIGTGTSDGAIRVRWDPPENLGGSAIGANVDTEGYVAVASPGGRPCVPTPLPTECIITGLTHDTPYTVQVTARNGVGRSAATAASATVRPRTSGGSISALLAAPAAPGLPSAVRYADNTVVVSWPAPADNNSPITSYSITANPVVPDPVANRCIFLTATSCMIRNLLVADPDDPVDPLDPFTDYTFRVRATNVIGEGALSPSSVLQPVTLIISPTTGTSPVDPPPVPPVVVPPYEPPPIVDINLSTTNPSVVDIPGYVAVPQGVFRLHNPNGLGSSGDGSTVAVSGGILAAAFRVNDSRLAAGSLTVPIGLVNPIVQRTFQIVSRTTSGSPRATSTAIVQVNQNGAYAINSWAIT